MTNRPAPKVFLREGRNPWSDASAELRSSLNDGVILQFMTTASIATETQIQAWIAAGETDDGENTAFAQVFLDPTNPRWQLTIDERIFAIVLYGDPVAALEYLPFAASKADVTDRLGRTIGYVIEHQSFRLGAGDVAWGDAAVYKGAISGGSGLSQKQDREAAMLSLTSTMDAIHRERTNWIESRRRTGGQDWYNLPNMPGEEYRNLLDLSTSAWRSPVHSS